MNQPAPLHIHWPDGLSTERFLADYWQKRPLLIRGAFPGFESPLSPDELGGLATEAEIASRIVVEHGDPPWQLRHGPFTAEDFEQLGEGRWSLLVSDVEKHLPDFADYLEPFRFIPDWRIDDLMISFAPPGGSVGPHQDDYDVFLLQAQGRRRWQIAAEPAGGFALLDGPELRIIDGFESEQEWLLEPGDMLYLPPRVAHHGVAETACMTWSIGFRAPLWRDLLCDFAETLAERSGERRYADAELAAATHPGEIDAVARARIRAGLHELLAHDDVALDRWFGRYITDHLAGGSGPQPCAVDADEVFAHLAAGGWLERRADLRYAFITEGDDCWLFAGGSELAVPEPLARLICAQRCIDATDLAAGPPAGSEAGPVGHSEPKYAGSDTLTTPTLGDTALQLLPKLVEFGILSFGNIDD